MKKHAGRPRLGTKNAKGVFFSIRFTPGEARQIGEAIQQARQSKSDWIRKTLLAATGGDKTAA
jgi:hypothetical protein